MSGDDVVVHCMAGRHRGGTIAVICRALLANESLDDAERHILQRREIEVIPSHAEMAEWVRDVGTRTRLHRLHPTESSNLHMEQAEGVPLCQHAQAGDRARRLRNLQRTTESAKQSDGGDPSVWPAFKW